MAGNMNNNNNLNINNSINFNSNSTLNGANTTTITTTITNNNHKELKKKFTKTFDLSQIAEDPMDIYLESLGLWKKRIARDGSCLFRAVAEQVIYRL